MLRATQNYKTYCAINGIEIDETIVEDRIAVEQEPMDIDMNEGDAIFTVNDEEDCGSISGQVLPLEGEEGDGDDDDMPSFFQETNTQQSATAAVKTPSRHAKTRVALVVRAKVDRALGALADKRARMCDENDFLRLLLGEYPSPFLRFLRSYSVW